jgi:hypothetical protein
VRSTSILLYKYVLAIVKLKRKEPVTVLVTCAGGGQGQRATNTLSRNNTVMAPRLGPQEMEEIPFEYLHAHRVQYSETGPLTDDLFVACQKAIPWAFCQRLLLYLQNASNQGPSKLVGPHLVG